MYEKKVHRAPRYRILTVSHLFEMNTPNRVLGIGEDPHRFDDPLLLLGLCLSWAHLSNILLQIIYVTTT